MKIAYFYKNNPNSDDTEGHITRALKELGHEVVEVGMGNGIPDCDFVLFHKRMPDTKQKKVCWYFDKINFNGREDYIHYCLEKADLVFVTDETWVKEHPHPKFRVLRQGSGFTEEGKRLLTDAKVAFTGSVYGNRYNWVGELSKHYGNQFQVFSNTFNHDLNNLCVSVPIFVAPVEPSDDYYWSSRVYLTLGSGGFLIHPRLKGLQEEYNEDELVTYGSIGELFEKIDYYLAHPKEREAIRKRGWEKTKNMFTYKDRVCSLIATVQEK